MCRRVTACFVALDQQAEQSRIAAFYTLASTSVLLNELPADAGKKLPPNHSTVPTVPAVLMGRLAVDSAHQGLGLGGALLADAIKRAVRAEIAAYALIVDAKDAPAAQFYLHHGFNALVDSPRTLYLPLASLGSLLLKPAD